jgi:hypothetical protein
MANIVYGSPFQSALEGKRAALQDVLHAGEASRQQRDQDLNYDFMKWYQPLKQAEAQNATASNLLKEAASIAHYSGDYSSYNRILSHYLGVPLDALPPGYANGKGGPAQTKAADLASGLLPVPLSYPGVIAAGGAYQALPGTPAQQGSGDPEIDALMKQLTRKRLTDELNGGGTSAPLPHLNPLGSITPSTSLPSKIEPVWADPGSGVQPPSPQDVYGLPKPQKQASSFSPWADEYQPPAPQPEETDGTQ